MIRESHKRRMLCLVDCEAWRSLSLLSPCGGIKLSLTFACLPEHSFGTTAVVDLFDAQSKVDNPARILQPMKYL
jgi:hypothetical protein